MLCVWVNTTANNVDTVELIYSLAIETALKVDVIEAVLTVEPLYHTAVDWLNDNDRSVEISLGIHVPYNPVNECTEEVSLTKLYYSFWHYTLRCSAFA